MRFLARLFLLAMLAALVVAGLLAAAGAAFMVAAAAIPAFGRELGLYRGGSFAFTRYAWISPMSLLFGPVILLAILFCIVLVIRALSAGDRSTGKTERATAQESRVMQELHQGLARMEDRVEALETILLDQAGPAAARRSGTRNTPAAGKRGTRQ